MEIRRVFFIAQMIFGKHPFDFHPFKFNSKNGLCKNDDWNIADPCPLTHGQTFMKVAVHSETSGNLKSPLSFKQIHFIPINRFFWGVQQKLAGMSNISKRKRSQATFWTSVRLGAGKRKMKNVPTATSMRFPNWTHQLVVFTMVFRGLLVIFLRALAMARLVHC